MAEGQYGFEEIEDLIRRRVYQFLERIGQERIEALAWVNMMTWARDWDHVEEVTRVRR